MILLENRGIHEIEEGAMDGWKDYFVDVVVHGKGHRKMCDENHEENGPHPPPPPPKRSFHQVKLFFCVVCVDGHRIPATLYKTLLYVLFWSHSENPTSNLTLLTPLK